MRRLEKIPFRTGPKWNITQICILFVDQSAHASLNRLNIKDLGMLAINVDVSRVRISQHFHKTFVTKHHSFLRANMLKSFAIRYTCRNHSDFSNQRQLHTRGIGVSFFPLRPILACLSFATFFCCFVVEDFRGL